MVGAAEAVGVAAVIRTDKVGLGWRPELASAILSHRDEIDVVEVLLDGYVGAPAKETRALRTLASQIPVTYHGVGLGMASSHPVSKPRVERIARTLEALGAEAWSEHLSFVRAGGYEIGHLAAPPRTPSTVEGTMRNLDHIRAVTGLAPTLENIATLIQPPGSEMEEPEWTSAIMRESGSGMLLDLHNLYANALNSGLDPETFMLGFPLECVTQVHLSGGHWIPEPPRFAAEPGRKRLLDDHIHDPPDAVFRLLGTLARLVDRPLTVILERDGAYPPVEILLGQLRRAREILRSARVEQECKARKT